MLGRKQKTYKIVCILERKQNMYKTEDHYLIDKAHIKNVYILDVKQKTYKVLHMQECVNFGKKTKDKQSCKQEKCSP